MLPAIPTSAPRTASPTRASPSVPVPPTSSSSIAVIGASNRCGPRRRSRPTTSEPATTAPRLHHRSEEHTSELQSRQYLVCRLLLDKKQDAKTTSLIDSHA